MEPLRYEDYQLLLRVVLSQSSIVQSNVQRYSVGEMAEKYPQRLLSYLQQDKDLRRVRQQLEHIIRSGTITLTVGYPD